jgi:hypothetical protein
LTDAIFCHLPPSFPGMRNAACLMTAGRRANTWLGYAGKLKHWDDFCVRAGVRQFPAQPSHVLCYLGYLQEEGAVKAGILQPYLSAINSWHTDMGLAKPAVGQAVNMLRRGYGEVQGDEDDEAVRRFPPTSCPPSSRWRIRHLRCPFAGLRPPVSSAMPLCFGIRVFASSIATSPSHRKDWHYSFMSRPAGATSLLRYIDLATTRSIISFAIGCACAATLAKLRYGRFPTDSTTPSHHCASTGGFRRLVTS